MIRNRRVIAVIGSRKYLNKDVFNRVLNERFENIDNRRIILLSGGCEGPDLWSKRWSRNRSIPFIEVAPGQNDKDRFFERNSIVAEVADEMIAFIPSGQMQSGTWNTILYFRSKNVARYDVYDENGMRWDRDWKQRRWITIERPGFFGSMRDKLITKWDMEYNNSMWRIAYTWGESVIGRNMALQLYEDAYYQFFRQARDKLRWLINNASNVYDNAKSNIDSHDDYSIQETRSTHLQDIAIRRVIMRMGLRFKGNDLVQIRSNSRHDIGRELSAKNVPFHMPEMIHDGKIKDYGRKGNWWNDGSIEDFYQRNKVLQVLK